MSTAVAMGAAPISPPDQIRSQRDRFLAFAFAASDLMLEADNQGRISFGLGAAQSLFSIEAGQLNGRSLLDLFGQSDAQVIQRALQRLRPGERSPPLRVSVRPERQLGKPQAIFTAYRMPNKPDAVFCTIRRLDISEATDKPLLSKDAFKDRLTNVLADGESLGDEKEITLVDLGNLDPSLPEEQRRHLTAAIGEILIPNAADGLAGQLADNRFAVVHDRSLEFESLAQEIERAAEAVTGSRATIGTVSLALRKDGVVPAESLKAVLYALKQFSDGTPLDKVPTDISAAIEGVVQNTLDRMAEIRNSINTGSLRLAYQPIVSIRSLDVHHYEALARFEGDKSPFEKITFAEQVGMAETLDLAICSLAVNELNRPGNRARRVAINISGHSLVSDIFLRSLRQTLESAPVEPRRILIEITESARLSDLERADKVIQEFRRQGHQVCVDDFGAGAASFQYLHAFTIDFVKLDGSYVKRLTESRKDQVMVKSIAGLCRALDIDVIAEHVETPEEKALISDAGIGFGQGWLFGKPSFSLGGDEGPRLPV